MKRKIKIIYELCNKYTKEEILEVLNNLSEEELCIIKERYGNNLDDPTTGKEWNREKSKIFYEEILPKIKKTLSFQKNKLEKYTIIENGLKSLSNSTSNKNRK